MKKFKNILIAIVAGIIILNSCATLDEDPVDFVDPQGFYQTEAQINAAMASAWGFMAGYWQDYSWNLYAWTRHADDLTIGGSLQLENLQQSLDRLWADYYRGINSMNNVLRALDNVNLTQADKDSFEGQVRFLRGFQYYSLTRFWGGVPLATEDLTTEELQTLERAPRDEVLALVVSDLEKAAPLLPASWPEGSGARPTEMTAKGLLATIYLNWATLTNSNERYTRARDLAREVINSGQHQLIQNVEEVFLKENKHASEFLFSVQRTGQFPSVSTDPQIWMPGEYLDGWGSFNVDTLLQNKYPDQPRRYAYLLVGTPEEDGTFTEFSDGRWYNRKYVPPYIPMEEYSTLTSSANTPLLRYPEILLTYAEADNALNGPQQEAIDALNQVRDRANGYVPNAEAPLLTVGSITKEEFKEEILNERFFELCFEHVRIYDILRHRMLPEANPNNPDFDEGDYLYPIPLTEIEETEGRIKQNPGNYDDLGFGFFPAN